MSIFTRLLRRDTAAGDTTAATRADALKASASAIKAGLRSLGASIAGTVAGLWTDLFTGTSRRQYLTLFTGWVYGCIQTRAEAIAELSWHVYVADAKADGGRTIAPETHWLARLKETPNPLPWVTWDTLVEGAEQWQSITGEAYWWTPKLGKKLPQQIWLMPSVICKPVSSRDHLLDHFEVTLPGGHVLVVPRDEMCYMPLVAPAGDLSSSLLRGRGRIEAAIDAIESSVYRQRYLKTYFAKGAMPEWVVESDGAAEMYGQDWEAFLARWLEKHQGPDGGDAPLGYLPSGWKLREVNTTANKAALSEMGDRDIEAICGVFGVPKGMLTGQYDAAAPATSYRAQKFVFLDGKIAPAAKRMSGVITRWARQYDARAIIATEPVSWSDPDEVRKDERHRLQTGRVTINALKRENGEEELNEDWANAYIVDPTLGVRADAHLKPPPDESQESEPAPPAIGTAEAQAEAPDAEPDADAPDTTADTEAETATTEAEE